MENSSKDSKQCCSKDHKCCPSKPENALFVAGVIFAIVSLVHLYRIFSHFPVQIGTFEVPESGSWIAFIVAGLLSFWMFAASCKLRCK